MKRSMVALFLLLAAAVSAGAKPKGEYRPGNYVGWASVEDGSSCYSSGGITENPATGQLETHSSGHCKPDYVTHYMIALDGWVYTLQQEDLLWNIAHDVLSPVLPKNSPVFMRLDKNRKTVHVRIGKQESRYRIVCCTVRQSP